MRNFTLTELNNRSGEVVEATYRGPVAITRHGKPRFVMMTADHYDRLMRQDNPRRVYAIDETPPELQELFAAELEKLSRGEGYDEPR